MTGDGSGDSIHCKITHLGNIGNEANFHCEHAQLTANGPCGG
jgi:hypothetical protein